jgi:hypothetical protein
VFREQCSPCCILVLGVGVQLGIYYRKNSFYCLCYKGICSISLLKWSASKAATQPSSSCVVTYLVFWLFPEQPVHSLFLQKRKLQCNVHSIENDDTVVRSKVAVGCDCDESGTNPLEWGCVVFIRLTGTEAYLLSIFS